MSDEPSPLLPRIRQGDTQALAEFIEGHRRQLLAYIERQLGSALRRKVEPEDIFQEVSADAVRAYGAMDLGERDPFSWLCQLAERRIIDSHRRFFDAQKRDAGREVNIGGASDSTGSPGLINLLIASMTTPSEAFSRNARELRVQAAVATLPEEHREVLRLRYVDGWPTKQIAEKIGKSDVAVRVMLTRTVQKLQEMLGDETI